MRIPKRIKRYKNRHALVDAIPYVMPIKCVDRRPYSPVSRLMLVRQKSSYLEMSYIRSGCGMVKGYYLLPLSTICKPASANILSSV